MLGNSTTLQGNRPISGLRNVHRSISPNSRITQAGAIKTVPLFQLVPLRRKNKEGVSTSNPNGIHSRTCESDSEDTVQSLSPLKLLECRTSPCAADRRPSDSSVKSIGSLGSKSRRNESTPKSRPRLSLQAALASESQSKPWSSSSHPVDGKSRVSSSTESERRLIVPGIEGGGVADRATPGRTSAARTSGAGKDTKGKDKRTDREKDIKQGIERENEKENERLKNLEIENVIVREKEEEIERKRKKDEERMNEIDEESKEIERQEGQKEKEMEIILDRKRVEREEEEKEEEREREKKRNGIVLVEEITEIGTNPISGQSTDIGGNSSCRIINKASTSSSVSTLATSSCSEKCAHDDKESSASELE